MTSLVGPHLIPLPLIDGVVHVQAIELHITLIMLIWNLIAMVKHVLSYAGFLIVPVFTGSQLCCVTC
jgi:hypothetical protein